MDVVIALDIGTSQTRSVAFGSDGQIISTHSQSLGLDTPHEYWVEQDALLIVEKTRTCLDLTVKELSPADTIIGIGITNQRETTIAWDKESGNPLYPAIVWNDTRTQDYCDRHTEAYAAAGLQAINGTRLDPYFSATKMRWLIDNINSVTDALKNNTLCLGTVDSFVLWHLTGGKVFATDQTNASRTSLMSLETGQWDKGCLDFFNIPHESLPKIRNSQDDFGQTTHETPIPILGMIGDQQAALLAHESINPGVCKCTLGTGTFALINTGEEWKNHSTALTTSVAMSTHSQRSFCLEASAFSTGSMLNWFQKIMHLFDDPSTIDQLLSEQTHSEVFIFPAFSGLGAPHWKRDATASISGLTLKTTKTDILHALMDSIAFQARDLIEAIKGTDKYAIAIDGGLSKSTVLAQKLASITQKAVITPSLQENMTALGAAIIATRCEPYQALWFQKISNTPHTTHTPKEITKKDRTKEKQWHKKTTEKH